jgi:hypothetical protein
MYAILDTTVILSYANVFDTSLYADRGPLPTENANLFGRPGMTAHTLGDNVPGQQ